MGTKKKGEGAETNRPKARTAWRVDWDCGGPGAGAGTSWIFEQAGRYYYKDDDGTTTTADLGGPWDSLAAALKETDLHCVTAATHLIRSVELTAPEMGRLLTADDELDAGHRVRLNDERWTFDGKGFRPATPDEAKRAAEEAKRAEEGRIARLAAFLAGDLDL
jgi:hypothetical protein